MLGVDFFSTPSEYKCDSGTHGGEYAPVRYCKLDTFMLTVDKDW